MKKIKIIITSFLFSISMILFSVLLSGTTVTIESKGRGQTIFYPDGTWTYQCVANPETTCTLEVKLPKN
jgi:hypothetical protein